jgi:hypothetical protein
VIQSRKILRTGQSQHLKSGLKTENRYKTEKPLQKWLFCFIMVKTSQYPPRASSHKHS